MSTRISEREITAPVALCLPGGKLNPDAVGWTRTPMHDTSMIGAGGSWGRNKRWEYWGITLPTHILTLTLSNIDYAAVHSILVYDRATGVVTDRPAIVPFGGNATLPGSAQGGTASAQTKAMTLELSEVPGGTRLRGEAAGVSFDVLAQRPDGHEALGVVVPWSQTRFQYTLKDVARPAIGWLELDGIRTELPEGESWAVLDHGRGRWPYRMIWNWGAASGYTEGRTLGLQLGGRWTDGSGSTENALLVDGRLHKISEELDWHYDESNWLAPWRISGELVDLTFTPFWDRVSATELGVFGSHGHQCFGHYSGWVQTETGRIPVENLLGWAEDVRNRW